MTDSTLPRLLRRVHVHQQPCDVAYVHVHQQPCGVAYVHVLYTSLKPRKCQAAVEA